MPENNTPINRIHDSEVMGTDGAFVNDVQAAVLLQTPRGSRVILYTIALLLIVALVWAWYARIDEVVKGMGKVIPASHVQKIQNLEGGILEKLHVQEGQMVDKDTLLLELRDIEFAATAQKNWIELNNLQAHVARLNAEANDAKLEFTDRLQKNFPAMLTEQQELFTKRKYDLGKQVQLLQLGRDEKQDELAKMKREVDNARETYHLSKKEYDMMAPLVKQGAASPVELLHAKQATHSAKSKMDSVQLAIPQLKKEIAEAGQKIEHVYSDFQSKALAERNELLTKLKEAQAERESLLDKVDRTDVRSPVKGVVKKINVDTIGGTIQPGMVMMEIVPLNDTLLIEAKIRPKDIGFIRHGQRAKVKLTAYDFAIYGGLEGEVNQVSADSITDQKGRTFFKVMVKINQSYLGDEENPLPIIPGMQAETDIVLAQKNVLMYIFKPLLKSKYH